MIKGSGQGTVTDELGYFQLNIDHGDSIQVSMIGYESKVLVGRSENEMIALMPLEELLQNVTILANCKTYKVGGSKPRRAEINCGADMIGTEVGTEILNMEKEGYLEGVNFFIKKNRCDSILFRMRLYQYDTSYSASVGPLLHHEDILFQISRQRRWIYKDLSDIGILVPIDGVVVTLEAIRTWGNDSGKPDFTLTYDKRVKGLGHFRKLSSERGWGGYAFGGRGLSFNLVMRE